MNTVISKAFFIPLAILILTGLLSSCTNNSTNHSSLTTITSYDSKTGKVLISEAELADSKAKGVHYVGVASATGSGNGQLDDITGDAGVTYGEATSTTGNVSDTVIFLNNVIYLKGNSNALLNNLGFTQSDSQANAEKWILITSASTSFSTVSSSLTVASIIENFIPSGSLKVSGPSKIGGSSVMTVSGSLPASASGSGALGSAKLFISNSSPHYILGADVSLNQNGSKINATITFSNWGPPPFIVTPPITVACSTIKSCT